MKTKQKIQDMPNETKFSKDLMNNQNYIFGGKEKAKIISKYFIENTLMKGIYLFQEIINSFRYSMVYISVFCGLFRFFVAFLGKIDYVAYFGVSQNYIMVLFLFLCFIIGLLFGIPLYFKNKTKIKRKNGYLNLDKIINVKEIFNKFLFFKEKEIKEYCGINYIFFLLIFIIPLGITLLLSGIFIFKIDGLLLLSPIAISLTIISFVFFYIFRKIKYKNLFLVIVFIIFETPIFILNYLKNVILKTKNKYLIYKSSPGMKILKPFDFIDNEKAYNEFYYIKIK